MKKSIRILLLMTFALGVSFACAADKGKKSVDQAPTRVLQDFKVSTLDGKEVSLYELYKDKGKVVVLNLFATWCPPCKAETPYFVQLQEQYKDRLVIVGISFDQQGPEVVKNFAASYNVNYDFLMGTQELAAAVQLSGIPRTFILTSDFKIAKDLVGLHTKRQFEEMFLKAETYNPKKGKKK